MHIPSDDLFTMCLLAALVFVSSFDVHAFRQSLVSSTCVLGISVHDGVGQDLIRSENLINCAFSWLRVCSSP